MNTKLFAKTNRNVSILGLGCMRLPQTEVDGKWIIDREKSLEMVNEAYNSGINYFDTAYMYHDGQSEDFMGEALSRYPRKSFMLATKMPIWMADTPEDMEKIFTEQLKKLKTDYFDFYLLHSLGRGNWDKCKKFGAYEFVKRKQAEGKIINVGFSFHDSPDVL
ncbi:MAG: aldo/keto reductase, partial [Ruminococcus sp.]|nr:aldo/keto reductase [Ruminococcus sp.]